MRIFSISVFKKKGREAVELAAERDLSSFGYFQRGSVGEFMTFFSKTLAERTAAGARQSVEEQEYVCHVHARADDMVVVVISDKEYPYRVAFSLISRIVEEFQKLYPAGTWTDNPTDMPFSKLKEYLVKYQKPEEADAMTRVQMDLEETTGILRTSMEKVLDRGEKIDDLVDKSNALSSSSKMFYRQAKKSNSCCVIS